MSWDPYLDLEAGVLRNRLGITDSDALRRAEAGISAVRIAQLAVSIGKGALFCLPHELRTRADDVFVRLAGTDHLRCRPRHAFIDGLAALLAEMNFLHPFREGNGRTQRAFLGQLARAAGHPIRWTAMDPVANVAASRTAHLDGDTAPLRALLDSIVVS